MSRRDDFIHRVRDVCTERSWIFEPGSVEIPFEDGRRQRVDLEFFTFEDEELVRIHTGIGSTEHIDDERLVTALGLNFRLPHGALAIHKNDLVMVDTLMVSEADTTEIAAALAYLAETADHFEKTMFGRDVN